MRAHFSMSSRMKRANSSGDIDMATAPCLAHAAFISGESTARRISAFKRSTIGETVKGYEMTPWNAMFAPRGTPRAIVERLNAEITRATGAPEMREAWSRQGATAMAMSPDEFARFMREDIEKWARIVKVSGARADR